MLKKLGQVCHFYSGTGFPVTYQGKDNGELPFYKVGDIAANVTAGNKYLSFCSNYITRQEAIELRGTIIPQNTVVFAKIGEALKLNRRAITSCDCLIDNNAMGIAPKEDILRTGYFFYYMKQLRMQDYSESTTVPSVRKSKLEQIGINVPSPDEQKVVEKKLTLLSDIILKREQELKRLDDLIKARFVEMFGDLADHSRSDKVELSEVCEKITDGEHGSVARVPSGHPFLNAKHVLKNGRIDWDSVTYVNDEDHRRIYKRCNPVEGDILLTTTGTIGNVAIMPISEEVSMDRGITLLKINRQKVTSEFVAELLKQPSIQTQMGVNVHASAIGHLFMNKVKKLPAILPSMESQREFTDFVRQVDKSKLLKNNYRKDNNIKTIIQQNIAIANTALHK